MFFARYLQKKKTPRLTFSWIPQQTTFSIACRDKMNTRGQDEQNDAKVLRFKQFYNGINLLEFKFVSRGAAVRLKHDKPREHCEN